MNLSFSYGRALQQPSLNKLERLGKVDNVKAAQEALFQRSKFNSEATKLQLKVETYCLNT